MSIDIYLPNTGSNQISSDNMKHESVPITGNTEAENIVAEEKMQPQK